MAAWLSLLILMAFSGVCPGFTIRVCEIFGTCPRPRQTSQPQTPPPPPPPPARGRGFRNQINGVEWVQLGQKLFHFAPANTPTVDWYGAYE